MTAPDGSPVELYLRLSPRTEEADFIHALNPGSILDLGCGVGRLSEPLAAKGHTVVAVDNEPAMLAHLRLSRPVHADIAQLRLDERFDAVLLMSHLVNHPDRDTVKAMLRTARHHLRPNGFAVIERYRPGWVATAEPASTERDGIHYELRDLSRDGNGVLTATMVYSFEGKRFEQRFQAREFDEARLRDFARPYHLLP